MACEEEVRNSRAPLVGPVSVGAELGARAEQMSIVRKSFNKLCFVTSAVAWKVRDPNSCTEQTWSSAIKTHMVLIDHGDLGGGQLADIAAGAATASRPRGGRQI